MNKDHIILCIFSGSVYLQSAGYDDHAELFTEEEAARKVDDFNRCWPQHRFQVVKIIS